MIFRSQLLRRGTMDNISYQGGSFNLGIIIHTPRNSDFIGFVLYQNDHRTCAPYSFPFTSYDAFSTINFSELR